MVRLIVLDNPARLHLPSLKSLVSNAALLSGDRVLPSYHRVVLVIPELRASLANNRRLVNIHCTRGGSEEALRDVLLDTLAMKALRQLLIDRPVPEHF